MELRRLSRLLLHPKSLRLLGIVSLFIFCFHQVSVHHPNVNEIDPIQSNYLTQPQEQQQPQQVPTGYGGDFPSGIESSRSVKSDAHNKRDISLSFNKALEKLKEFEVNVPIPASSSSDRPHGGGSSSLEKNSIPVQVNPLVSKTVQMFDKFMTNNGDSGTIEKYNVFKSMMILWNRDASKWASNASMFYREQLEIRGDHIPDYEAPRQMKEVRSTVEQCGCQRNIMSNRKEGETFARNSSTCSLHSLDRGNNQRVRRIRERGETIWCILTFIPNKASFIPILIMLCCRHN